MKNQTMKQKQNHTVSTASPYSEAQVYNYALSFTQATQRNNSVSRLDAYEALKTHYKCFGLKLAEAFKDHPADAVADHVFFNIAFGEDLSPKSREIAISFHFMEEKDGNFFATDVATAMYAVKKTHITLVS